MSTWEQRMGQRAAAREREQHARDAAQARIEHAQWVAEEGKRSAAANLAKYLAGPPGGCWACWTWEPNWLWDAGGRHWEHGPPAVPVPGQADDPDPAHWCAHSCHGGDVLYIAPVLMAAGGGGAYPAAGHAPAAHMTPAGWVLAPAPAGLPSRSCGHAPIPQADTFRA